jgi:hypothetical protein
MFSMPAGFEVLRPVLMKIQVFWNMTLCRLTNSYWHFREHNIIARV